MFDITFVCDETEPQSEGWEGLPGCTMLGDYAEEFLSPIGPWQRSDYERQWIEAARRLLGAPARAAFFTTPFRFWWVMWREGDTVIVHEELLTPERLSQLSDWRAAPYHLIRECRATAEDGRAISEWYLSVADIEGFLARRSEQYVSGEDLCGDGRAGPKPQPD